jgi:hypothetical protein
MTFTDALGRTGFCIHPADTVRAIPKVGGTKDVNPDKIRALAPTHLIVNIDENAAFEREHALLAASAKGHRKRWGLASGKPRG